MSILNLLVLIKKINMVWIRINSVLSFIIDGVKIWLLVIVWNNMVVILVVNVINIIVVKIRL